MALSDRIRAALEAAGLTQAELARRIGVSQPSVNDWLSGKTRRLKYETAVKAAAVLRVRPEWLAWGSEPIRDGQLASSAHASLNSIATPSLPAALPVVLDAIRSCPDSHREELRSLLTLLVDHDAPAYRQRLAELLAASAPALPVESRDFQPPVPAPVKAR